MRHSRAQRRAVVPLVAVLAGVALVAVPAQTASAAEQTVVIDLADDSGAAPSGVGRGFLYGLSFDGSEPSDDYLLPLRPTSFRSGGEIDEPGSFGWGADPEQFDPRYEAFRDQAQRVTRPPYEATMDMIVSDLWGSDGSGLRPPDLEEPCDDGPDCANWKAFLAELIDRLGDDGLLDDRVRFDIWNEPSDNNYFWPRDIEQYYEMWNSGVETIRALYPDAIIVGPSSFDYHGPTQQSFLDQAHAAGTMPDVWNWHFSVDPVADEADIRARLAAKGITDMPLAMNEYLRADQQDPGHTAWYLARLQRTELLDAAHAIWSDCCGSGLLDGVLVRTPGDGVATTGSYWVYEANAQAPGTVVALTPSADVDGIATRHDERATVSVTLGSRDFTGSLTTRIEGFDEDLAPGGAVTVLVERLSDGPQAAPTAVQSRTALLDDDTLEVTIDWPSDKDAYRITVTPVFAGPGSVDGDETGSAVGQFAYGPGWGVTEGVAGMYAGTANWSSAADQTAVFTFDGTAVQLYAVRDADQGVMSVAIDGGSAELIDNYRATRDPSALVWSAGGLEPGTHVVTIRSTGTPNPASSGSNVTIDRAEVDRLVTIVDGSRDGVSADSFAFSGGGTAHDIPDLYNGTANWLPPGETGTIEFHGRQIWLYGVRDSEQGGMSVSIDGGTPVEIDNYAPARESSALLWTSPVLEPGPHTVVIEAIGAANPASTGANIAIDRVAIDQRDDRATIDANVYGTGLEQWEYSSGWGQTTGIGDMYAGTARWSPAAGSTATFRFEGSSVAIRAVRDTDQGIARITIDGGTPVTVDNYAASREGSAVIWESGELAPGPHTVVLEVTGDRHPASSGFTLALDAADISVGIEDGPVGAPGAGDVALTLPFGTETALIPPLFPSGFAQTVSIVDPASNGTANAEGITLRFEPEPGFSGTTTFRYLASNVFGDSSAATASVTVLADPNADNGGGTGNGDDDAPATGGDLEEAGAGDADLALTGVSIAIPALIALSLLAAGIIVSRRRQRAA